MSFDPLVGREALIGVRRLVVKYGKTLQQLTWTFVFQFLETAVDIVKQAKKLLPSVLMKERL